MKRLIASLVVSLGLVLANVSSAVAVARYWEAQMFDPAASTTERKINIAYNVFSTVQEDDDFTVELFENESSKGIQNITHPKGDSGAFSINIPATGTYKYKIVVDNNDAGETKQTAEKTVQVVDGPAPTVTTVFVNNANAAGGAGGGQGAGGGAGAGGAAAAGGAGEVAGATADEGEVDTEAANDEQNQEGDVLGASAKDAAKNNRGRNTAIAIVVAVAVAGGAYYYYLRARRTT